MRITRYSSYYGDNLPTYRSPHRTPYLVKTRRRKSYWLEPCRVKEKPVRHTVVFFSSPCPLPQTYMMANSSRWGLSFSCPYGEGIATFAFLIHRHKNNAILPASANLTMDMKLRGWPFLQLFVSFCFFFSFLSLFSSLPLSLRADLCPHPHENLVEAR
ncbi:hypothetical protein F5X96DRAFT_140686 [Biscogniauxia mediterranea]|nr:hypothetical protein F5X96DRAFT_140686 [Biscogniauxia mediterranea]